MALGSLPGLLACTDGAHFESGNTLVFEGAIEPDQARARHDFIVTEVGLVQFQVEQLEVTDPETGNSIAGGSIGLSIGRPFEDDEGPQCQPSYSNFAGLGEEVQVHLQPVAYCLQIFRSTGIQVEHRVEYYITAFTRSGAP